MAAWGDANKELSFILNIINQYNKNQDNENTVKFIYPGTSLDLAWVGKTVTIVRPNESEILMIPHALIPQKILRKKYGINPIVHAVSESKTKTPRVLAGAIADREGVLFCIGHHRKAKLFISIERIHQSLLETLIRTTPQNYIRNLIMVSVLMSNLKLLDPELPSRTQQYLKLLEYEIEMLLTATQDKVNIPNYLHRYARHIRNIINARLYALQVTEQFRSEVTYQYPILYCSTIDAFQRAKENFMRFYNDELNLETIKFVFTPLPNVSQLQDKLKDVGLAEKIKVYGYTPSVDQSVPAKKEKEKLFLASDTINGFLNIINSHPELLQQQQLVEEKIVTCLEEFSAGKGDQLLAIAVWLLKHVDVKILEDIENRFNQLSDMRLYIILHNKSRRKPGYGELISELLSVDSLNRLQKMPYLQALVSLRKQIKNSESLFDFNLKLNQETLESILAPNEKDYSDRDAYLGAFLQRLQAYFTILSRDTASTIEDAENIDERLSHVRTLYSGLLAEYAKNKTPAQLDPSITESELYQVLKDLLPNQNLWDRIKVFGFKKTKTAV